MGFFSSRKAEDNDVYQVTLGLRNDKSAVQVIRSRFYGKKGKEREASQQPAISFLGGLSAAQALSNNVNSTHPSANTVIASKRSIQRPNNIHHDHDPEPSTPSKKRPNDAIPRPSSSSSRRSKDSHVTSISPSPLRKNTTDTVTITLAQRLDELAVANSDGLLNDDEYRLLRQNLFERFASKSTVPTEASIVPVAAARQSPKNGRQVPERPHSRHFQLNPSRHTSRDSRLSASFGVPSLFRRATSRQAVPQEPSDASSIWSGTSNNSNFFRLPRVLSKKSSDSSISTNISRVQTDTVSISSRQPRSSSDRGHGENPTQFSPRSTVNARRLTTPPSSFPARIIGQDNRIVYNVFDEEHLNTVKEITQEIQNMEAEAKRLVDAFNGLELTTLAKLQRHHIRPSLKSVDYGKGGPDSHWSPDSDSRSHRRIVLADDAMSTRSGASARTTPSVSASLALSAHSAMKATRTTKPSSLSVGFTSKSGSLHRKKSTSSIASEKKSGRTAPVIPSSISHGHLKSGNLSNISLLRSTGHLPMDTVMEDEKVPKTDTVKSGSEDIESEMEDIRRHREEVSLRYDARLEYLRAKLKGAQLHEKLKRK